MNTDALTALVGQLVEVQEQKARLNEREETLKAALRAVAPIGATPVNGITLSLTQVRKLDVAKAEQTYPRASNPNLYVLTLDPKRLKAHISPAEHDELMVPNGEPRVSLR